MKLLLIVTVLLIAFQATLSIRVKRQGLGRFANESSFGIENYIIGGVIAENGFAPSHVSIQTTIGSHFCSGSIIDEYWILTAAHCVVGWDPARILVSSGSNDLYRPEAYYYVSKIFVHCNFDNPLYHNDIALLRLDSPIEWDEQTQPIEIATELISAGSKLQLTGWGKTEINGYSSQYLRKAEVDYVAYENCKERYKGDSGVDTGHICSLSSESVGVCHGDSGAPLVSNGKLVGLVNWGEPCAKGYPDVHASVFFYHDWIRTTIEGCYHEFD